MTPLFRDPRLRPWFAGRRALVIGLGKSGTAAATLLDQLGARVAVTESRSRADVAPFLSDLPAGVELETGGHGMLDRRWDLVVPSPGVPRTLWDSLPARGAWVWGELELAYRVLSLAGRWPRWTAAVTGTNGKTTTTALLGAMFQASGRPTVVAGNIGTPLCRLAERLSQETALALEVSSYQLEATEAFRPAAGALLNVTPDHLGRHGTLDNYARTKFLLFRNQRGADTAVLNADDSWCRRRFALAPGSRVWFGSRSEKTDVFWDGRHIRSRAGGRWPAPAHLPGRHNLENAMAAVSCALALSVPGAAIRRALAEFRGVDHRLQFLRDRNGVRYVNDSKATNVDSTRVALAAFAGPIRLILGGQDKGAPYTPLAGLVRERVAEILLIGEAAGKIEKDLAGTAPLVRCGTLDRAVARAAETARPGDIVLLSPACASFDQFDNFEHRGRTFHDLVRSIT